MTPRRRPARKGRTQARAADRYELYHASVQCPEAEIAFVERVFRREHGRRPLVLREDFCGTGWVACEWAKHRKDCSAVGVDLDPVPLAWGEEHLRSKLGPAAQRVQLVEADVRAAVGSRADVVLALNFSYLVFHQRAVLLDYFRQTRKHVRPDGLFIMDAFGGKESMDVIEESTPHDGFTYVWDQDAFDPITHALRCHIHFRFPDGSSLPRAFTYDWRLWTLPELTDLLAEAGFARTDVYLEGTDQDGEGSGIYRKTKRAEPCEGLVAYLVSRPT